LKEQLKGQQKCLKKRKLPREKVRSSLKGIWQIELKCYQPLTENVCDAFLSYTYSGSPTLGEKGDDGWNVLLGMEHLTNKNR
jgi:hypothetical protein